ncbi:MAG: 1-(5-phosphoribosyl)-5-[(5-phosphoribosylamino)methylideneamino]imidazole-4-carboxamide isomerase [Candidatus Omnitrophica bacterium]|nr:1-(5-phosphoribosyl)-5-[(5-phosphoribosylamino)methylideneamino]imidazole-4-carboxamide isomerase [Candidatus Omnitrophota bacterium]MBD3269435.1 1-(5-phosphoribosyl)-5-[(5-phosphoribosylamino)methylideneamino]imidazole-4-carboxamide isomerase [Candidatus Omnitrophota bacterium]
MLVIPAIDLWDGKVVRLRKGDPANLTVYSKEPLEVVKKWEEQGAGLIHLIDLSAATGAGDNKEVVEDILKNSGVDIQIGGGIRTLEEARALIKKGARRIILGTKAVDEDFLDRLSGLIEADSIAVSVDTRDGLVAVKGWKEETRVKDTDFLKRLEGKGIRWVIYTDISLDGTLEGVSIEKLRFLEDFSGMNIIISGGVSCLEDIKNLKKNLPFIYGAITGKALYEGRIDYRQAKLLAEN